MLLPEPYKPDAVTSLMLIFELDISVNAVPAHEEDPKSEPVIPEDMLNEPVIIVLPLIIPPYVMRSYAIL